MHLAAGGGGGGPVLLWWLDEKPARLVAAGRGHLPACLEVLLCRADAANDVVYRMRGQRVWDAD